MKNYLIIGIILLFPFRLFADEPVKAIYAKITNPDNKEVTVVAHRADWRFAPENSLAAIESSIRLGADVVELDVQKTKDGQLILMHDKTLDRTTTGKGKVAEWTLDSIRTLRLKNGAALSLFTFSSWPIYSVSCPIRGLSCKIPAMMLISSLILSKSGFSF